MPPGPDASRLLVIPTNDCGTPTPIPTFTDSPHAVQRPSPITPTFTVTSTPYPVGCGTPVAVAALNTFNGCSGNSPVHRGLQQPWRRQHAAVDAHLKPAKRRGRRLMPPPRLPTGVQPLTLVRSDPTLSGGTLATYYLDPAADAATIIWC